MAIAKNWRIEKLYGTVGGARFAAVTYLPTGRRFDVPIRGRKDGGLNAWGDPYPYEETRRAKIYEMADKMYASNPRKHSARAVGARNARRNPSRPPRGSPGHLAGTYSFNVQRLGGYVEQMKYQDREDSRRYVHDFGDLQALMYLVHSTAFGNCILIVSADDKPLWENA